MFTRATNPAKFQHNNKKPSAAIPPSINVFPRVNTKLTNSLKEEGRNRFSITKKDFFDLHTPVCLMKSSADLLCMHFENEGIIPEVRRLAHCISHSQV